MDRSHTILYASWRKVSRVLVVDKASGIGFAECLSRRIVDMMGVMLDISHSSQNLSARWDE